MNKNEHSIFLRFVHIAKMVAQQNENTSNRKHQDFLQLQQTHGADRVEDNATAQSNRADDLEIARANRLQDRSDEKEDSERSYLMRKRERDEITLEAEAANESKKLKETSDEKALQDRVDLCATFFQEFAKPIFQREKKFNIFFQIKKKFFNTRNLNEIEEFANLTNEDDKQAFLDNWEQALN
jgi:hypothetical protein